MDILFRPARRDDLDRLLAIGIDGHETLRLAGAVPDSPSSSDDDQGELRQWLKQGTLLAAIDAFDRPVGYGSALPAGDWFHICELDVAAPGNAALSAAA